MAFDPDKFLSETGTSSGFDPDKFLKETSGNGPFKNEEPPKGLIQKGLEGIGNFVGPAMNSLTLGAAPYGAAGLDYLAGKLGIGKNAPYSEHLQAEKGQIKKSEQEHPIIAGAGEALGAMAPALITGGESLIPGILKSATPANMSFAGNASLSSVPKMAEPIVNNAISGGLTGAAQGVLESNPGEEIKSGLMGGLTSAIAPGLLSGAGNLIGKGSKKLEDLASTYALRSVTPRAGEIEKIAKQSGVPIGQRLEKTKEIGNKALDELITPGSLTGSPKDTFRKIAENTDKWGGEVGNVVDKYADARVNASDLLSSIFENKNVLKESAHGDPEKVKALEDFFSQRVADRAAKENGSLSLKDLWEIQKQFKTSTRSAASGIPVPGKRLEEAARNEIVNSIDDTIRKINPADADLYRTANKEYSFYRSLLEPSEKSAIKHQAASTQAQTMGGGVKGLSLNPRDVLGGLLGNERLAALLKYGGKSADWIAQQMSMNPAQKQALQNMLIQENR